MNAEQEKSLLQSLDRIANALERIVLAIGPGDRGRNSVTILDQLCAIADDTREVASHG